MMDCEGLDEAEAKKQTIKLKHVIKILPYIQKHGFNSLKMDDAAKCMDISKATMYKYFSSKEEIIESLVLESINYIDQLVLEETPSKLMAQSEPTHKELMLYGETFNTTFKISIKLAYYLSNVFLDDLNNTFPELATKLVEGLERCRKKLISYFDSGMELGVFHQLNSRMLLIQLDAVLRELLDPKLLMLHNVTLKQALLDFYQAMKHQVFSEQWIHEDQPGIEPFIHEFILRKLSNE
ncbi:TetR/AcrR family transcriptional regulator [Paenibacillus sp. N1-5-1-14]|uniref:TetR/AcrR family transcriptional regulator n=1 Tax=Paenibacillus radicibacter TaxID=2972488 RepID=UPI002158C370|nr:TetR/AcrR family transcriptional regulator [Paenibacillus radicibacter]MCR8643821.1 TetR/AcrR family transcriptional regulator [Paenibacillus radicibacter]